MDEYHGDPARFSTLALNVMSWNVMYLWVLIVALIIAVFGGWVPSRMAANGFFGMLGAASSTVGQLFVLQLITDRLRAYEKYRPELVRRIEALRTMEVKPSEG